MAHIHLGTYKGLYFRTQNGSLLTLEPIKRTITYFRTHNGGLDILLNVIQLLPRNARMFKWCVERQEPPGHTPDGPQRTRGVENRAPPVVSDEESTQWIGEPDAKAET